MLPAEIAYFAITLFLALAFLIAWKRRHTTLNARLNKGLRGYVAAGACKEESQDEELLVA